MAGNFIAFTFLAPILLNEVTGLSAGRG